MEGEAIVSSGEGGFVESSSLGYSYFCHELFSSTGWPLPRYRDAHPQVLVGPKRREEENSLEEVGGDVQTKNGGRFGFQRFV